MDVIVQQLETLFIGAIPTILLFIVLVMAYQFLVQEPLSKTLQARRERTVGAMEEAQMAIAQAEARSAEYSEKLRQARGEVFKLREARMQQWSAERDAALETARSAAQLKVTQAKAELEVAGDGTVQTISLPLTVFGCALALERNPPAAAAIKAAAGDLARQVVGAVLPAAAGGSR